MASEVELTGDDIKTILSISIVEVVEHITHDGVLSILERTAERSLSCSSEVRFQSPCPCVEGTDHICVLSPHFSEDTLQLAGELL